MSPLSSLKRLSISSNKGAKSSSVSVNGHLSPLDIACALNIQSSSPISPWASTPSSDIGRNQAELLEDDNMSWGTGKASSPRSKNAKRRSFGFF